MDPYCNKIFEMCGCNKTLHQLILMLTILQSLRAQNSDDYEVQYWMAAFMLPRIVGLCDEL